MSWTPAAPPAVPDASRLGCESGTAGPCWPRFWGASYEWLAGQSNNLVYPRGLNYAANFNATGRPHYATVDVFSGEHGDAYTYAAGVLDWLGPADAVASPGGTLSVHGAGGYADVRQPHDYGFLWVPSTAGGANGTLQWFFDRSPVGTPLTWARFPGGCGAQPADAHSAGSAYLFGVLDCGHLVLNINTPPGQPLTVYEVHVFQAGSANNLQEVV